MIFSGANFGSSSGDFSWIPGFGDEGSYEVTFIATSNVLEDYETITITVGDVDRAPELASIGNKAVVEDDLLSFTVSATDPDGDTITYSSIGLPSGANFGSSSGDFSWIPGFGDDGNYDVTFIATSHGLEDSETITITVGDVDRAPELDSIGNKAVNENELLSFTISATDPDGDTVTYSSIGLPSGANFGSSSGDFSWTPGFGDEGSYEVTFIATSNVLEDYETITITVGDVDRAPELASIGNKAVNEDDLLSFTVSATDPDGDGITYSYSSSSPPASATLDPSTGKFSWTPSYDDGGSYDLTFIASSNGLTDSETITITVGNTNRPPRLAVIGDKSTDENSPLSISLSAEEDDGDVLSYSATPLPEGAQMDESTGIFTWTPTYEQAGSYKVQFVVSDGTIEDTEEVTITVNNINRPPVMDIPDQVHVAENTTLVLSLNTSDPDDDTLEYSMDPSFGTLQDGIFSWTPGYEDEGVYSVTFTVKDAEFEISKVLLINVTHSNSAPVLYSISDRLVNELETVTINLTAIDIDGDELTFSKDVSYGNLTDNIFTWTPGINDSNFHDILFTVSDGQLSDSKTATIAVGNTNIPPVLAHMETQHTRENEILTFILDASDVDNDTLTYSSSNLPIGANLESSTGQFSWIPTYEQAGSYTVEFSVSDKIYTAVETAIINVENVNRAPVFVSIPMYVANETQRLNINLSATDPDGDSLSFSTDNVNGTITGNVYAWTPGYYDSGDHYIDFNVTDGELVDATTVHVKVHETNMPPEIDSIGPLSAYENVTLKFFVNATDGDYDSLTYSASGLPTGASFNASTRQFIWKPSYAQSGTYSVEFWVSDGELDISEAVSIKVYDVNRDSSNDLSSFLTSSSSSSGGGSSSGAEDYDNVAYKDYGMKYVTQGVEIVFEFPNVENDLEYVKFSSLKAAGQVKAIIEILKERSSLVNSNPPGSVYRHINIWVGDAKFNSGDYMSSAEISFKVAKKWLVDNNADPSTIKFYRYSTGSWEELETSRIGTDANYYYYKAQTPGFSPFSIVSTGSGPVLMSTVPESTAGNIKYSSDSESILNSIEARSESEALNTALEHDPVSPVNTGIFFIGIIGILAIGSVIGYRSRNESVVLSRYYEALYSFSTGIKNAAEWTKYKLSLESMHNDYAVLSGKLTEIKTADYKTIYEKTIAEIKERQKQ
ncbi:putative Ig domain-containing protein [Methanolobus sp. ZRKC4]|uniref:putative Ig domain-containing protein n=1 Tax=Methanolobus sp. ZRKC4 TaxID=3125787 RepID=UPI003254FE88